jgi:oligopeptide/dipeptide ABC transporter ATP-binding protein
VSVRRPHEAGFGQASIDGLQVDAAMPAAPKGGTMTIARTGPEAAEPLLAVSDLHVTFRMRGRSVFAVNGLSYALAPRRTLAIIGESGSGKTVASRAIMGLLPPTAEVSGSIRFNGREIVGMKERDLRAIRTKEVAMVFQNPERSLNPTMRIGPQITEAIRLHMHLDRKAAHERTVDLLRRVRLPSPERRFYEYPHQLSGGMRQRVMIALALSCEPKLLIADEATTALDVTTQAQIMDLLLELQAELGMALILISHDMGLAASYTEEVIVMYAGRAVERAPTKELFSNVRMPYTKALLEAIPRLDAPSHTVLPMIEGRPPDLSMRIPGCAFAPRCPEVQDDCRASVPEMTELASGHAFACFHPIGGHDG